jgi:hypothetical protein
MSGAMRHEMLVCSQPDFLYKLTPFSPDDQWVERACKLLTDKKLLGTPAQANENFNPSPGSHGE